MKYMSLFNFASPFDGLDFFNFDKVENTTSTVINAISDAIEAFTPWYKNSENLEFELEKNGNDEVYTLILHVSPKAKKSDFNIDFDEETSILKIIYIYKIDNDSEVRLTIRRSVPQDAMIDTLSATVVNGVLTVFCKKK